MSCSIPSDVCGHWCHAAYFANLKESVPEEQKFWLLAPHDHIDLPPPGGKPTPKDLEDERVQYVIIETAQAACNAAQWHGVSALEPQPPLHMHPLCLRCAPPACNRTLLPPSALSSSSSALASAYAVLPPTYALHAVAPALVLALLMRYLSTISPMSGVYLRAPTSWYTHIGGSKFAEAVSETIYVVGNLPCAAHGFAFTFQHKILLFIIGFAAVNLRGKIWTKLYSLCSRVTHPPLPSFVFFLSYL
ncbi:hypothetical protein B0H19DRAFT_1379596 [Mycena capillaripes]|nr:hypothetical protein B0H19DRAFT_1379596 [Mycena capillaripes]